MSEKKAIYHANLDSLPTLKVVLGDVQIPYQKRGVYPKVSTEIKPGIEMESVINKLITHLKKKL